MKKPLVAILAAVAFGPGFAADPPAATPPAAPTEAQMVERFRADLQAKAADVMAKGLTLSSDQAAKFWPLFQQFQNEQSAIVDGQLKATQKYAANFKTLTDADALAYVNALLERDQQIHDLRIKWLKKFQEVVPVKIAARAIHLERRLGLAAQIGLAQQLPLIQ